MQKTEDIGDLDSEGHGALFAVDPTRQIIIPDLRVPDRSCQGSELGEQSCVNE